MRLSAGWRGSAIAGYVVIRWVARVYDSRLCGYPLGAALIYSRLSASRLLSKYPPPIPPTLPADDATTDADLSLRVKRLAPKYLA